MLFHTGMIKRTRLSGKPPGTLQSPDKDVYFEYERVKKMRNSIDFDDFIPLTLKLLSSNPHILAKCRKRFQV